MALHQMATGKKKSELHGEPLFKVVATDFGATHGGEQDYTNFLPTLRVDGTWVPGEWLPEITNPVLCKVGYHLTNDPYGQWHGDRNLVFFAEGHLAYDDGGKGKGQTDGDKISFSQIRLLRPDDKTIAKLSPKMGVGTAAAAADPYAAMAKQLIDAPFLTAAASAKSPGIHDYIYDSKAEAEWAVRQAGGSVGSLVSSSRSSRDATPGYSATTSKQYAIATAKVDAHIKTLGYRGSAFPRDLLGYGVEAQSLTAASASRKAEIEAALAAHKAGFGIAGRSSGRLYLYRRV